MNLLDHGYIQLVDFWGSDERIVEAARMSTNKGFQGWGPTTSCKRCQIKQMSNGEPTPYAYPAQMICEHKWETKPGDEKLLAYLWKHKHTTPFEMAGMTIEVQAPIFVFREWHRHRTQSYNELSARYTPLPPMDYMPSTQRCLMVSGTNKQASRNEDGEALTHESALDWLEMLAALYEHAERVYQAGLQRGIPKELARLPVMVGRYSRMRASANLWNWLRFLQLRSTAKGPGAQYEIRMYADALGAIIAQAFPRTWELFQSNP